MSSDATSRSASDIERINEWLIVQRNENGQIKAGEWMANIIPHLTVRSAESSHPNSKVIFALNIQPEHCNRLGNLHGGCAASIFDMCTSLALVPISQPGFWQLIGVTRTLNVTYMRPAPSGTDVLIECEVLQIGKKICALRGTMTRESDGQLLCVCEHNKVNIDPEAKI